MSPTWQSTYRHTAIGDGDIRLLVLEPEGPEGRNSKLQGQLASFVLTVERGEYSKSPIARNSTGKQPNGATSGESKHPEAPQYEALSYTWGGDDGLVSGPGQFLHIFDYITPKKPKPGPASARGQKRDLGFIIMTQNLEEALRTFRADLKPNSPPLLLWIDSICILQDGNHYEKSAQIGKMADIYTEAERVRVWLGRGEEGFADVRQFIKQILTLDKFDEMCKATENAGKWNALRNLMQLPWFQRRWIVQEIAFARQATVHWGCNVIPWNEFASAVQLFASKKDTLRKMFHKSGDTHHDPDFIGEAEAYGAKNLVDTIDKMLRKSEDGNIMELLFPLESILTTMTAFDVSRPHDTVYSIIQLSNDARPASDRTIVQDKEYDSSPEIRPTENKLNPAINVFLSQHDQHMSESPERFGGVPRQPPDSGSMTLNSAGEWAATDQRGRTVARTSHASTHLAVRNDTNLRSRSRGRSPAAAKTIAEKAYRKPRKRFVVDYDKSILSLCTEVINFVTEESKSLDIICKPWAPNPSHDDREDAGHDEDRDVYPSWIQPFSGRSFSVKNFAGNRKSVRVGADSLAGTQHRGFKTYSASGIVPPERPRGAPLIEGRILNARGFVLDKIAKIAEPAVNAIIPTRWLDLGWIDKKRAGDESLPPEQFWRTLVANRESSNGPTGPPLYWRQACQWAFSQQAVNGNLNTAELIHNLGISGAVSKPVGEFLHRLRSVVWDRALIRTEDNNASIGLLGLAPKEAQKGDLICILYGCSVPVVLRRKVRRARPERSPSSPRELKRRRTVYGVDEELEPRFSRSTSISNGSQGSTANSSKEHNLDVELDQLALGLPDNEEYSFIGECYIHGMMDGEAFSQQEKYNLNEKEKTFRIGCAFDCNCQRCEPRTMTLTMEEF